MKCITIDDDPVAHPLLKKLIEKVPFLELDRQFTNPLSAIDYMQNNHVDIAFIDVKMPEMSGLEFIESLKHSDTAFIIISGDSESALASYNLNVVDYLLKPFVFDRFLKAVMKAKESIEMHNIKSNTVDLHARHAESGSNDFFFIKDKGRHVKLKLSEISIVEALADYVIIHTTNNQRYIVHSTMRAMEERLPSDQFLRIHVSFIVRLDCITEIEDCTLTANGRVLPISRSRLKEVRAILNFL